MNVFLIIIVQNLQNFEYRVQFILELNYYMLPDMCQVIDDPYSPSGFSMVSSL